MVNVYFSISCYCCSVFFFVFYFVTSLVGSRLTLKLSLSIGKSMLKGGLFWDIYTQDLTMHFALMGFINKLNEPTPRRIT